MSMLENAGKKILLAAVLSMTLWTSCSLSAFAQSRSAQIVSVVSPTEVTVGQSFSVNVTIRYLFPHLTRVVVGIYSFDINDNLDYSDEDLSGSGSKTYSFRLTAPPIEKTWRLSAHVHYQIDGDWKHDIVNWSRDFDIIIRKGYSVAVSVSGLPSGFSTAVYVDSLRQGDISGGGARSFTFDDTAAHSISVDEYVYDGAGIRYRCSSYSWSFSSASSRTFVYVTQYYLKVVSAYGNPQGEGWYDEQYIAVFSVTAPAWDGVGTRYTFLGWTGDSKVSTPNATIVMDGPHVATAEWRQEGGQEDYSQIWIVIAIVLIAAMLSFVIIMRSYTAQRRKTPSPLAELNEREMYNRYLTRLEELKAKGKISEKTYRELRSEYERKSRESSN